MSKIRPGLALLAALVIPACDGRWDSRNDDHELWITNQGVDGVRVQIHYGYKSWTGNVEWDQDFDVWGGQASRTSYPNGYYVKVDIFRTNGTLLFATKYDSSDFEDHDGRISILVNP